MTIDGKKSHDILNYTDGSVARDQPGLEFTVNQKESTVQGDGGACRGTTSSLTMEVEAVTHAIQWLTSLGWTTLTGTRSRTVFGCEDCEYNAVVTLESEGMNG